VRRKMNIDSIKLVFFSLMLFSCDSSKSADESPTEKESAISKLEFVDLNNYVFDDFRSELEVDASLDDFISEFGTPDESGDGYVCYYNWKPNYIANAARRGIFGLRIKHFKGKISQWVWLSQ